MTLPKIAASKHSPSKKTTASKGTRISKRAVKKAMPDDFSRAVGRALRRASKRARETARMHGTPIYVTIDGKIVAIKP